MDKDSSGLASSVINPDNLDGYIGGINQRDCIYVLSSHVSPCYIELPGR